MNPTSPPTAHRRRGIDWRAVAQLGLGVAAGIVAGFGTIAVAVTSFSLSFDAISAVARAAHIRHSLAWMMPVSVDGAMLVATVAAVVMHRMGKGRKVWYPWMVVIAGTAISIACNAAHATGETNVAGDVLLELGPGTRKMISAIPAVMLALSVHLFVELVGAFLPSSSAGEGAPSEGAPAAPKAHSEAHSRAAVAPHSDPHSVKGPRTVTAGSEPLGVNLSGGYPSKPALPAATSGNARTGEGRSEGGDPLTPHASRGAGDPLTPSTSEPRSEARTPAGSEAPSEGRSAARSEAGKGAPSAPAKRTGKAPAARTGKPRSAAKTTRTGEPKVTALTGRALVERIHRDMPEDAAAGTVSGRKVRLRYGIGAGPAGEVATRYKDTLTELSSEPTPESSEPPAEAAGGGA